MAYFIKITKATRTTLTTTKIKVNNYCTDNNVIKKMIRKHAAVMFLWHINSNNIMGPVRPSLIAVAVQLETEMVLNLNFYKFLLVKCYKKKKIKKPSIKGFLKLMNREQKKKRL